MKIIIDNLLLFSPYLFHNFEISAPTDIINNPTLKNKDKRELKGNFPELQTITVLMKDVGQ